MLKLYSNRRIWGIGGIWALVSLLSRTFPCVLQPLFAEVGLLNLLLQLVDVLLMVVPPRIDAHL